MCKKLHASYWEPNGCYNCQHVFVKLEYDGDTEHFCNKGKSKRPLCGSVCMGENRSKFYVGVRYTRWMEWAKPRVVQPHGICVLWQSKEKHETKD